MELIKLFFTPDEQLYDKRITDVFDAEVFSSNFWLYWRTMFAFENWHSALETKLYLKRYIHHVAVCLICGHCALPGTTSTRA